MSSSSTIERIQQLIRSAHIEEAHTELSNLLRRNPHDDQAWTIAAQLTSDRQQRKEFLKKVFDSTSDSRLADWAFRSLAQYVTNETAAGLSLPPTRYLAVLSHARIPLDDLLTEDATQLRSAHPTAAQVPEGPAMGYASSVPSSDIQARKTQPKRLPFSLKRLGEVIMLGAGVLFISIVYYEPFMQFFIQLQLSPFYYCFLPLLLGGALITLAGFLVDRN